MNIDIDRLVDQCYNALPSSWKSKPWEYVQHGVAVLDSEDQLNAYIASYGEMHIVKCRLAMKNFPFADLSNGLNMKEVEIFDWGCGQGIGTLTFLQFLSERTLLQCVRRITLIEPSQLALDRAQEWIGQSINARTEIRCIKNFIPSNGASPWDDIIDCGTCMAIHICSNILDIREVGLQWLATTATSLCKENIFICVGPLFGKGVSRISDFHNYLGAPECFTDLAQVPCGYTSRTKKSFGIEAKCFKTTSKNNINGSYIEQSDQRWGDEYVMGEECFRGAIPDAVLHTYKIINSSPGGFNIYLKPSVGIERPDFLLTNISKGILILNVCEDVQNFERDLKRVGAIKQAFIDTYIKRLKIDTILNPSTYGCINIGLYFPNNITEEIETICREYYGKLCQRAKEENKECPKDPTAYLLKLCDENIAKELSNITAHGFRFDYYQELHDLILGKWHHHSQGDKTLRLNDTQQSFVDNEQTRLRIKGVAGCGKTQVLAHKAVKEHIRTGEKVLICTYNITLIEYIKMRINQVPADFFTNAFEIINYHQFFSSKAKRYSTERIFLTDYNNPNFFERFKEEIIRNGDQYSTIIVDETQDYTTQWLDCLQKYFLKEGGKFILFGDGEQNIYNREIEAESKMPRVNGFGKSGWRSMSVRTLNNGSRAKDNERITMRTLNPDISKLASDFALQYGVSLAPIRCLQKTLNLFDYKIGYRPISSEIKADSLAEHLIGLSQEYHIDLKEIVVLGQSINLLRDTDYALRKKYNIRTMTTFESLEDYREIKKSGKAQTILDLKAVRRVSKVHFTTDTDSIKLSTISSFKGWESKTIVLIIQKEVEDIQDSDEEGYILQMHGNMNALLYTGITRARENLFIFNLGNETYHKFFKEKIK